MSAQNPWLLLFLTGNTTLVHKQLPDFLSYTQQNLSIVRAVSYDDIVVNSASFDPVLIVNVSVGGNSSIEKLQILEDEDSSNFPSFFLSIFCFVYCKVSRPLQSQGNHIESFNIF